MDDSDENETDLTISNVDTECQMLSKYPVALEMKCPDLPIMPLVETLSSDSFYQK
jgi:hypothetical protein